MIPLILSSLLIAGGSSFLGNLEIPSNPVVPNHTLAGEKIPSKDVVCRDRWGTPMLPDGKASYSLIAPISSNLIAQSLWIPPVSGTRPKSSSIRVVTTNAVVPAVAAPVSAAATKALPAKN